MNLTTETIDALETRWRAGESVKKLAAEAGVPWQTLNHEFRRRNASGRGSATTSSTERRGEVSETKTEKAVRNREADRHEAFFKDLAEEIALYLKVGAVDEGKVREICDKAIAERLPRPLAVSVNGQDAVVIEGRVHAKFEEVMQLIAEGHTNILLVGPAGSGKTTLAKQVAEALKRPFGFISLSGGVTETHLLGRVLPQKSGAWEFQPSRFIEIYEQGGVFLLDEIDAADSNVMVAVNAALANGSLANPNGMIHSRHTDTIIIGAANTWGRGGDTQYVGRNQLDGATLDRFCMSTLSIGYDEALERDIAVGILGAEKAVELVLWVKTLRARISETRLRRIASTRLVVGGAKALKTGKTLSDVKARYFQDWSTDEMTKAGDAR